MTLQTEASTRTPHVARRKNNCAQCGAFLLAPDWSEYLSESCVRHTWSCEACGYRFETAVFFARTRDKDERAAVAA